MGHPYNKYSGDIPYDQVSINIECNGFTFKLFIDGYFCEQLESEGYLNLIALSTFGDTLVISKEHFKSFDIGLGYMNKPKTVNASTITEIWCNDGFLYAFHWDGFTSKIKPKNFKLLKQDFTK